jgi:hypothetical protein
MFLWYTGILLWNYENIIMQKITKWNVTTAETSDFENIQDSWLACKHLKCFIQNTSQKVTVAPAWRSPTNRKKELSLLFAYCFLTFSTQDVFTLRCQHLWMHVNEFEAHCLNRLVFSFSPSSVWHSHSCLERKTEWWGRRGKTVGSFEVWISCKAMLSPAHVSAMNGTIRKD